MKRLLALALLVISSIASAKTYYVAPTGGSDAYPGTITQPWATWQQAFNNALAGDTVYFRGGVWYHQPGQSIEIIPGNGKGHSGTAGNYIHYLNYPGEKPILDGSLITPKDPGLGESWSGGPYVEGANYLHWRGLTIRNYWQIYDNVRVQGFVVVVSNHQIFENITVHNIGGRGIYYSPNYGSDTTYFLNCDVYNCIDSMNTGGYQGGWADGWNAGNMDATAYLLFDGCRAWNNSDDGINTWGYGLVEIRNCWSFLNGVLDGDGDGFKLNPPETTDSNLTRKVHNNIAAYNGNVLGDGTAGIGFDENNGGYYSMKGQIYNNTSYHNYIGFASGGNLTPPQKNNDYRNNISSESLWWTGKEIDVDESKGASIQTDIKNTWTEGGSFTLSDADFVSTDVSQLSQPRKADGSLPEITFLKLAQGSDLIDAGIDVGLPFSGSAPDLGYSEYLAGSAVPPTPAFLTAVIENATPSRLYITYDLTLANIVPVASAFTVTVNSSTRAVSSVSISGTKVLLTIASPVAYGNVVTVAYTKPATNPLQTSAGGQAASFTARSVTNNVAPVNPVYVSSVVENATPSRLEITYNLTLASVVPSASAFTVTVNSAVRSVSSVAISGTKVLLTLSSPVAYGNVVTIAYTKPSTNPLQTSAGGQVASFTARSVTNNVAPVNPVYVSSVVENATPGRLEITYDLALANIIPASSAFTVRVNSSARTVNSVAISGTKVLLTLASPVVNGDVVTVAYTKPATNPLQTSSGGQAVSITAQSVINNCSLTSNQPPVINITSPSKSLTFISPATITLEAAASDPDGTIAKVEYYNGTTKLGERTLSPYSFTWKDVLEGTYTITAVASDNLNAKTVSAAVTVVIEKAAEVVNQIPVVTITSPGKSGKYKKHDNIVIVATASDPDGTISKVELKSGNVTIGEATVAPYSFTLENVDTGKYVLTVIATDNLGATSASSSLEFFVELLNEIRSTINKLYPNPNDGHFSIDISSPVPTTENSVTIVNLAGEIVYRRLLTEGQVTEEFDLSGSAPGTYILLLYTGNTITSSRKFIKR